MLYRSLLHLQMYLYPHRCLLCAGSSNLKPGFDICRGCLADLPRLDACCVRCAAHLVGNPGAATLCGNCLRDPPPFIRSWCLGPYLGGYAQLITGLKFAGKLENSRLLGQLLGRLLRAHPDHSRLALVPVPLHPARMRQRGFNQAREIARWAARESGTKLLDGLVRRRRDTRPQTGLGASARRSNLRAAFACDERVDGRYLAIVDDVITTGSTARSLASALCSAGCVHVEAWCCARASM